MTPNNAKACDEAVEALIAASLRAPDKEPEITEEEISRYVDQCVTLGAEDEEALERLKSGLTDSIKRILREDSREKVGCTSPKSIIGGTTNQGAEKCISAPDEFVEAVIISQLTRLLSSPQYPLGRFRCNKLSYFSHRKAEEDVSRHYMKKAAGPYSPWARYRGPESIAIKNRYVQRAKVGGRVGLLPGEKIENIDQYIIRYPVCAAIEWVVAEFRYTKKEELELLATVDFAVLDLRATGSTIKAESVRRIIAANKEWAPKLDRAVFSEANIDGALQQLRVLFPTSYTV